MVDAVVLTGGTRGLGAALAAQLGERSDIRCVVLARNTDAACVRAANQSWIECELAAVATDPASLAALKLQLEQLLGCWRISRLTFVNNAGSIEPLGDCAGLPDAALLHSINVNLSAPALIAGLLFRWASGKIIPMRVLNISSGAALKPIQGWAAYCSTKAASRMFFDVMALDGVEVVHVDPGVMDTGMQEAIRRSVGLKQHSYFESLWRTRELRSTEVVASEIIAGHFP